MEDFTPEMVKFNPESVVEYSPEEQAQILQLLQDLPLMTPAGESRPFKSFYQDQGAAFVWIRHFS
jgi:hypothetical protein